MEAKQGRESITLSQKLEKLREGNLYPFHMPGHKRNPRYMDWGLPFERDITEIEGFDNLHHPEGVLKEGQERLSACYKVMEAFFLVNGSTCGNLAAISACTREGDKLLMGRNAHKSAYHAAFLRNLQLSYLVPSPGEEGLLGDIRPSQVEEALLREPEIRGVFLTSPTYDGVVSDIRQIARICHAHGIPLIVDGAHGAHFGFSRAFPEPAQALGADVVIVSLHKTLPALTQTAALLRCTERVSGEELKRYLSIYQTSSPSYVLMESMDRLATYLSGEESRRDFETFSENLRRLREHLERNRFLKLITPREVYDFDRSKILLSAGGLLSGKEVASHFRREYGLEMEMEAEQYCLALTSVGDRLEGFERLWRAAADLDGRLGKMRGGSPLSFPKKDFPLPRAVLPLSKALCEETEMVPLGLARGRVSAEFLSIYPPGIPLVVPGEVMEQGLLSYLEELLEMGWEIHGCREDRFVRVVKEWEKSIVC